MKPITYIIGSIFLCALIGAFANSHYSLVALGAAALGALVPHGLEHPTITHRFGYHTLTHSLLGLVGCGLLLSPLMLTPLHAVVSAVLIGTFSHLLLDAATPRGVMLFYPSHARAVIPRHPLLRIEPGSARERGLRWWLLCGALLMLPLNAMGVRGLLHQLIPASQFAVEDYVTYSSQGRRVFVTFTGRFNASQRNVMGRWEVLDATSNTSLLVEDPQGIRYTLGSHPDDTIRAFRIRAHTGPKVLVALRSVHLQEQSLSDLSPLIPATGKTYLIGTARILEHVPTYFPVDQFRTIHVGANQLEFRYATVQDLRDQQLTNLVVTEGEFLLRTIADTTQHTPAPVVQPTPAITSSRIITVPIHHLDNPQEVLVHANVEVRQGQLLADLQHYRAELLGKQQAAQAQLVAAQDALDQLRLKQQQELLLKQQEDQLAGVSRDLTLLKAKHEQELAQANARIQAVQATLAQLTRELASTYVRAPVAGRIISVRLQQSTATIRILTHE